MRAFLLRAFARPREPWLRLTAGPRLHRILIAAGARDGGKDGQR